MSGEANYAGALKADLEEELAQRGITLESGSGKGGRVLTKDMVAALEADDAASATEAEPTEDEAPVLATTPTETLVDEPADDWDTTLEEARTGKTVRLPEVGEIVSYRDKFSGQRKDARVSLVHDRSTVNLAVFRNNGADQKTEVFYGNGRGQWSWK